LNWLAYLAFHISISYKQRDTAVRSNEDDEEETQNAHAHWCLSASWLAADGALLSVATQKRSSNQICSEFQNFI
jgi:hypothetical protein